MSVYLEDYIQDRAQAGGNWPRNDGRLSHADNREWNSVYRPSFIKKDLRPFIEVHVTPCS